MVALFRQLLAATLTLLITIPADAITYDAVGNRTQKVSTLPGFPGGLSITTPTINSPQTPTTPTGIPRLPSASAMPTTSRIT